MEVTDPEAPLRDRIRNAGKNILRLSRSGGHSSQPLDYIEQELILRGLEGLPEGQVMAIAMAGGSFSLGDSAALHRVGLLDLPKSVPQRPAQDVLRIYRDQFHGKQRK